MPMLAKVGQHSLVCRPTAVDVGSVTLCCCVFLRISYVVDFFSDCSEVNIMCLCWHYCMYFCVSPAVVVFVAMIPCRNHDDKNGYRQPKGSIFVNCCIVLQLLMFNNMHRSSRAKIREDQCLSQTGQLVLKSEFVYRLEQASYSTAIDLAFNAVVYLAFSFETGQNNKKNLFR